MEIHLIRHPKVAIQSGICYGQSDIKLSDEGLEMIQSIEIDSDYDVIYTSPLTRCTIITEELNLNSKSDSRLMELNFGAWELKDWNEIPANEINPWYKDYINIKPPNGESLLDLVNRINSFIADLSKNHPNEKILIITHAGVIRSFFHLLLDIPLENIFQFDPNYAKITKIKKQYKQWTLKAFNL